MVQISLGSTSLNESHFKIPSFKKVLYFISFYTSHLISYKLLSGLININKQRVKFNYVHVLCWILFSWIFWGIFEVSECVFLSGLAPHWIPPARPGLNFTNIFTYSFYARSSHKRKSSVKLSVSFYAFGISWRKSCS